MIEIDRIYNEDCLEGMKRIPDGSMDCIICDLPYGVLNSNNPNAKWDVIIPFESLWEQYERVIKDNGAIVLFAQGMFTAQLMMSNPKLWRYNLVWKKGNRASGFLNAKIMPLRNHEDICVFYKNLPTYNPQMEIGQPLHSRGKGVHKFKNSNYGDFNEGDDHRAGSMEKYPFSIIDFDRPHPPIHPTQKPVDLLRYLVLTYSNKGETILDNCMGSGTTAIACIKEKRHFIGFELNKEYYDIATKRIEAETAQQTLF